MIFKTIFRPKQIWKYKLKSCPVTGPNKHFIITLVQYFFNGPFPASFSLFCLIQLTGNKCSKENLPDYWIRIEDLWSQKQPLYQLNHNDYPKNILVQYITNLMSLSFTKYLNKLFSFHFWDQYYKTIFDIIELP